MKIERIDNGIYVIDDFLTESEEVAINLLLKGAVWRYFKIAFAGKRHHLLGLARCKTSRVSIGSCA